MLKFLIALRPLCSSIPTQDPSLGRLICTLRNIPPQPRPFQLPALRLLNLGLDSKWVYVNARWCENQSTDSGPSLSHSSLVQIQSEGSGMLIAASAEQHLQSMNVYDICIVLQSLKQFQDRPSTEFLDAVTDRILKQKTDLRPAHIAQLFNICSRLGYRNPMLFEALADQALLPFQMEAFSHRETSTILHAIGNIIREAGRELKRGWNHEDMDLKQSDLGGGTSRALLLEQSAQLFPKQHEFIDLLLKRFVNVTEYDTVNAWNVANAFYGVSVIPNINPEVVKKLANMAIHGPIFREMTEHGLTSVIHAFGFLNYHDPEAMELLLSEVLHPSRLPVFSEYGLAEIVHGLGLLKYDNWKNLTVLLTEAVRPWRLRKYTNREFSGMWFNFDHLGVRDTRLLDPMMKEAMYPARLQSVTSKQLFSILMSMARLKYRNNDFLHAFVQEVSTERRMSSIKDNDYPAYIWILGQLQYNNAEDVKTVMKSLLNTNRLENMINRSLSSILYGLSECSVQESDYTQPILEELSKPERLSSFQAYSLASVIHSLGRMQHDVCPLTKAILDEALRSERMPQYTEYGLVAIVNGLTNLGVSDHQMLKCIMAEIRKPERISAYEPGALTCLIFGLSSLRTRDTDLVTRLAEEIVKEEKLRLLSGSGVTSLIVNLAALRFQNLDVLEKLLRVVVHSPEIRVMSNAACAGLVYALGQLRYNNSMDILLPIIDELTKRRASFKNHELGAVINGLGHMGLDFKDFYTLQHIVSESLSSDRVSSYTIKELGRVCSALSLMNYTGPGTKPLLERLFHPDIFHNLNFRDLAGSAYALGHAGLRDPAMVSQLKKEIFKRGKRAEANQRYLALLIQGITPMCSKKDHSLGQMLLEMVHYQYEKNIDELTNQNITAILYGLGRIGVVSKSMLYPFVLDSIKTRRLQQYTVHGLATLVFGLGQFRFQDREALMPVVQEVCRESRIKYYLNRQLIGTIFSFCNMDMAREDLLEPLMKAATLPNQLEKCGGDDLSMLFFSFVKIKPKKEIYVQNALAEIAHPQRLKTLTDMQINAILFSITNLRSPAIDVNTLRPIVDQICIPERIEKMQESVIGSIMYSLGRLEYTPIEFLDIIAEEASKPHRLREFNETALTNIINTVGKAKYDNRTFLNTLMDEAVKSHRLTKYHEGHIVNIIFTLGSLRFCHGRFVAFMDRVLSDVTEVDKFQPKTLLTIMHTYNLLGVGTEQMVTNVSKSVFSNPKRFALLTDVQLECLMETLGNIQRHDRTRNALERTNANVL